MDPYQKAREQFNQIATLDLGDPMPEIPLLALQVKLHRWQQRCFGGATDWQMALGMIEEMGELWETRDDDHKRDAVGDICIFGSQLLNLNRLGLDAAVKDAENNPLTLFSDVPAIDSMSRLARTILKGDQKIRGLADREAYREAVFDAVVDLFRIARARVGYGLEEIIIDVAENEVLKRGAGHEAVPG